LGKRIGVHPLILLLGVYIGLKTLGFQGVILAPISIIMFKAVYDAGLEDIYFSCLKQKKE
ncbi:MAG: AI-2E family transporter, partial [Halanaerobiaceae bacterium]|nr:AI-2E family transporter [Halanaerobiaceae bacterium]